MIEKRTITLLVSWALLAPALAKGEEPSQELIRSAVKRGIDRIEIAAKNYPNHRDCFSCHHQTMPVVALVEAKKAGIAVDEAVLEETLTFSAEAFERQRVNLKRGTGIGGGAMTVSYGLWTFWEPDRPATALTEEMAGFLLKSQAEAGNWKANSRRPPLESSEVTSTVLAAMGLDIYATPEQRPDAKEAIRKALAWMETVEKKSQEDRVAWLWGLWYLDPDECKWEIARADVLKAQRPDGGWAQEDGMESDAYATGMTLSILRRTGTDPDDPLFQRGIQYLLKTQNEDGSWKVQTRSRPIQTFFDNGDPHGESQFISTAATCWAVRALVGALE